MKSDACRLAETTDFTFSSQGAVFGIDEMSGGLALSHKLVLKTRDYPGNPGEVTSDGDSDKMFLFLVVFAKS